MTDVIILTNAERMELRRRASSRTDRAEDVRRARLILLLAEGHTWDEASERIRLQPRLCGQLEQAIR